MKLQTVNFEIAKLLKEVGFNWPTLWFYQLSSCKPETPYRKGSWVPEEGYEIANHNENTNEASSPTQALVIKWLRDEHNLSVEVFWNTYRGMYTYAVTNTANNKDIHEHSFNSASYEECEKEAIMEALNFLEK